MNQIQMRSKIKSELANRGFISVEVNISNMDLFFQENAQEIFAVMTLDISQGNEILFEKYNNLRRQIQQNFRDRGYNEVSLLCLFLTDKLEAVKEIAVNPEEYWTIDLLHERLVVFENQKKDYLGLRNILEEILYKKPGAVVPPSSTSTKSMIKKYLNMCNVIIVSINIIIFIMTDFFAQNLIDVGALSWYLVVEQREYWRLFTHMFLHGGMSHIFNNMLMLTFLGNMLEKILGEWKYLVVYFGSGIIAGLISIGYNMYRYYNQNVLQARYASSVGASGAIFGVVGAMAFLVICNKGRIQNISRNQIILFVAFSLYGGFTSEGIDNAAHVGGLLGGFLIAALLFVFTKNRERKSPTQ